MINFFLFLFLSISLILFQVDKVFADSQKDFSEHMRDWQEKKELASFYLMEAEKSFKSGDELSGCVTQQKAGEYGIQATESLISAMRLNNSTDGLENLESGLNKWRELRDFCQISQ